MTQLHLNGNTTTECSGYLGFHFRHIYGHCRGDWTACCRYSSCRCNYAPLLYNLNGGRFNANPKFIVFLSNCCAVRNAVVVECSFIFSFDANFLLKNNFTQKVIWGLPLQSDVSFGTGTDMSGGVIHTITVN